MALFLDLVSLKIFLKKTVLLKFNFHSIKLIHFKYVDQFL